MLLGRDRELAFLVESCRAAAAGHGSTVVVTGEPGIGKTALLTAVSAADPGWRALYATGVEAESAVAFATLHGLLWPLREELAGLEQGQAALLRGLLDLGSQVAGSSFSIGAATLSLLSVASREHVAVVVVDDAQWADAASQEVLAFVGRRLEHERVALLVAVRDGAPSPLADEHAFAVVRLGGLDPEAARSLLDRSAEGLAADVAERLVRTCAGNPLGLVELPLLLTDAQRRGIEPLPAAFEAGPLVQRAFAARIGELSDACREALLVLAVAGDLDAALEALSPAARRGLEQAEELGLIVRSGRVEFRHPLLRTALYGAATATARRVAHRRLAEVTVGARRAWHLAEAAAEPDEAVATLLAETAAEARRGGGVAAEAQALERAAALSPERDPRAARLLGAARALRLAGRIERADELLAQALDVAGTVRRRAEIQLERGAALLREDDPDAALGLLLAEAEAAAADEPKLAAGMLVKAALAAHVRAEATESIALAERALALAGRDGDRSELDAVNALVEVRTAAGAPPDERDFELVARAADLLQQPALRSGAEEVHWISYCLALHERDEESRRLSDLALAETRAAGDVWNLCYALYARAAIEQLSGRLDVARTYASEGVALAEQLGEPWRLSEAYGVYSEVEGERGNLDECRRATEVKLEHWGRDPSREFYRALPLGTACLACGRLDEAIPLLETAAQYVYAGAARAWYHLVPLRLAEALAVAGRAREAERWIRELAAGIESCALVRPKTALARVRALLAPEASIDAAFQRAAAMLDEVPQHLERARVELNWGERLLGAGRASDSVPHLEQALSRFEALAAVGWAERARARLENASGTARPAQPRETDALTAQELRVSRHAAAGMRDREIAALLYLSPRTVESYLLSAYRKLGVTNRTQLAGVLAADGIRPTAPNVEPVPQDP